MSGRGREILEQADCKVDGFCSGIGTGGTISGVGKALKEANPKTLIWAVEPEQAAILSGKEVGSHLQMGIGDGLVPKILNQQIYDDIVIITDEEALKTAKILRTKEGSCAASQEARMWRQRRRWPGNSERGRPLSRSCRILRSVIFPRHFLTSSRMRGKSFLAKP